MGFYRWIKKKSKELSTSLKFIELVRVGQRGLTFFTVGVAFLEHALDYLPGRKEHKEIAVSLLTFAVSLWGLVISGPILLKIACCLLTFSAAVATVEAISQASKLYTTDKQVNSLLINIDRAHIKKQLSRDMINKIQELHKLLKEHPIIFQKGSVETQMIIGNLAKTLASKKLFIENGITKEILQNELSMHIPHER